jgi:AmmeMemoRadiSam system protein B
MSNIRRPAVAGMFYPGGAAALRAMVDEFMTEAAMATGAAPKAVIAPHAGLVYSGPIAANAYAQLAPARDEIQRIVLLGPSHRVPFRGLALSSAERFSTPLGEIPLDREAMALLEDLPQVQVLDRAHAQEHSLEVQLPFLQRVLGEFRLVPLVVGEASADEVAEVIERLWGGPETRFVISSDLSHYHDYATARRMDQATSEAIETLRPEAIGYEDACGRIPVSGLLRAAQHHGLHGRVLDLRNSGDTAGPRDQVVGYGAYAFDEAPAAA